MKSKALFLAGMASLLAIPAMAQKTSGITLGNKIVCTSEITMKDGTTFKPGKQDKSGKTIPEQVSQPTDANSFASSNFLRGSECTDRSNPASCYRFLYTDIPGLLRIRTEAVRDFDVRGIVFRSGTLHLDGYRRFRFDDIKTGSGDATVIDLRNYPENSEHALGVIQEPLTIVREARSLDLQLGFPNAVSVKSECVIDRSYEGVPVGRWEAVSFDESSYDQATVFYYGYGFTKKEASKTALAKCRAGGGKACVVGSSEQNDQQSPIKSVLKQAVKRSST